MPPVQVLVPDGKGGFELRLFNEDGTPYFEEDPPTDPGGSSGHEIRDEGVALPARTALDFVGAGVSVTDTAGVTRVQIPGGDGGTGSLYWIDPVETWDDLPVEPEPLFGTCCLVKDQRLIAIYGDYNKAVGWYSHKDDVGSGGGDALSNPMRFFPETALTDLLEKGSVVEYDNGLWWLDESGDIRPPGFGPGETIELDIANSFSETPVLVPEVFQEDYPDVGDLWAEVVFENNGPNIHGYDLGKPDDREGAVFAFGVTQAGYVTYAFDDGDVAVDFSVFRWDGVQLITSEAGPLSSPSTILNPGIYFVVVTVAAPGLTGSGALRLTPIGATQLVSTAFMPQWHKIADWSGDPHVIEDADGVDLPHRTHLKPAGASGIVRLDAWDDSVAAKTVLGVGIDEDALKSKIRHDSAEMIKQSGASWLSIPLKGGATQPTLVDEPDPGPRWHASSSINHSGEVSLRGFYELAMATAELNFGQLEELYRPAQTVRQTVVREDNTVATIRIEPNGEMYYSSAQSGRNHIDGVRFPTGKGVSLVAGTFIPDPSNPYRAVKIGQEWKLIGAGIFEDGASETGELSFDLGPTQNDSVYFWVFVDGVAPLPTVTYQVLDGPNVGQTGTAEFEIGGLLDSPEIVVTIPTNLGGRVQVTFNNFRWEEGWYV